MKVHPFVKKQVVTREIVDKSCEQVSVLPKVSEEGDLLLTIVMKKGLTVEWIFNYNEAKIVE